MSDEGYVRRSDRLLSSQTKCQLPAANLCEISKTVHSIQYIFAGFHEKSCIYNLKIIPPVHLLEFSKISLCSFILHARFFGG